MPTRIQSPALQSETKSEQAAKAAKSVEHKSLLNARFLAQLTMILLVAASSLGAEPNGPGGDDCLEPIPAELGNNLFDTSSYTTSSIPGEGGDCGDIGDMHKDIWFSHTFASDGLAKVSTCSPGSFDTGLTVYEANGSCESLRFVVSSAFAEPDDSCQPGYSENIFVVTGGKEYLIRIGGFDPEESGPGSLSLTFTPQPNPCDCPPDDPTCPSELVAANSFPIPGSIEFATDGIFAIWWDGDFSHASDTATMFSRLASVRNDSLNHLGMRDPPNPGHCLYYNIYVHHGAEDDFPGWWGNGQGTDGNCRPYLTLPDGVQLQESNTYHEGFHVFQYSADSPGFSHLDAEWYTETSAQWYMATKIPEDDVAFLEAGAILANPQLALWHAFGNGASGDPEDWLYLVRQYGMHTFLFYLTEVGGVQPGLMTEGFYNGTELLPQEFLFARIGGETFRQLFADWAAQNTAGLIYLTPGQVQRALEEAEAVGDPNNFNNFVADVAASDLENGWTWQACPDPSCHRPRGWAYNVIRIAHETAGQFLFQLDGDPTGSEGAPSHFESRIVIMEPGGPRFETMNMAGTRNGQITFFADADVSELFVVIVSAPDHFTGNQTYGYTLQGSFQPGSAPTIFRDGFESGNTSDWSSSAP